MRKLLYLLAFCMVASSIAAAATRSVEWMLYLSGGLGLFAIVETDLPLTRTLTWRTAFERLVKERHAVTLAGKLSGWAATLLLLAFFIARLAE